jgi:tetratricopeptide (TPR) repeat protein
MLGCNTELNRARKLASSKSYETAAMFYEKALQKDPDNADIIMEITDIYCDKNKNTTKCFEYAIKLYKKFPNDPKVMAWYKNALYNHALGLFIQQRLEIATDYLRQYLKFEPQNGKVYYMLADAKFRLNREPPRNDSKLNNAIELYRKAIELTKPSDTIPSSFDSKEGQILQWEACMKAARIYEMWIAEKHADWKKKIEAEEKTKPQPKKPVRSGRRAQKTPPKPKFPINQEHFAKAIELYELATKIPHPNKYNRSMPYLQAGLFYANFLEDDLKAIEWLKKAEKENDTDPNVIGNMKMIYDRLKEAADNNNDKALAKKYSTLSVEYDSKFASLQGRQ